MITPINPITSIGYVDLFNQNSGNPQQDARDEARKRRQREKYSGEIPEKHRVNIETGPDGEQVVPSASDIYKPGHIMDIRC